MPASLENFKKVVLLLKELTESGPVALRVIRPFTPFAVDFDVHFRDDAVASAVNESGLSRKEFRDAIEDAEEVLASALQASPLNRAGDDGGEDEKITEQKVGYVREHFDIEDLRKRSWIKANTKSDVLLESGWDVSLKVIDEAQQPPGSKPVPVGLLALKGSRAQNPVALIMETDATELLLTTDRSDIKAMMQTLRRLDEALASAERSDD